MTGSDDHTLALSIWRAVNTGTIDDVQEAIYQVRKCPGAHVSGYVNWPVSDDGTTTSPPALYVAVIMNDAEKVCLLIDCGADLFCHDCHEMREEYGNTHNRAHVFDILDEAIHDWNHQDPYTENPYTE